MEADIALRHSLYELATELRQFVLNLQRPELADQRWFRMARQRGLELADQVQGLRQRLGTTHQTLANLLADLYRILHTCAEELRQCCAVPRLRQLCRSLARKYEDVVRELRHEPVAHDLRALRLPKLARAGFHVFMGVVAVFLYQVVLTWGQAMVAMGSVVALGFVLEVGRRLSPWLNGLLVDHLFRHIIRPRERYQVNSATYMVVAMLLIGLTLPQPAVCAAILVLALGDPIASLVGQRWGRVRLANDKTLVGCLAFFVTSMVVTSTYFLWAVPDSVPRLLGVAFLISMVGTITELKTTRLDDNFTIPVVCAVSVSWCF
jgi:dolichol kinase